jgi:hypothetical protein
MLIRKKILSSVALSLVAFTLSGCASNMNVPASAAEMATTVLAPIATWNPVAGAENNPGFAASGSLQEDNAYFETRQTFEVWNYSGEPLPEAIRMRHQQGSNSNPRQYYRD